MEVRVGTSGYSYKPWKGTFYPKDLPDAGMLGYYARQLPAVEINNTFYRMPTKTVLARWAEEVPEDFCFVLKAPQRITHQRRLSAAAAPDLSYFVETAASLGPRLGPLLFQLPPFLKKDVARLRDFLGLLPSGAKAAFEFRHASWFDEETYAALRGGGATLCSADTDDSGDAGAPIVPTASWGYLRLRRADYSDEDLAGWAARIRSQPWEQAFVFFKHEEAGKGPALAARFIAQLGDAAVTSAARQSS
jgi:uncharacterized protein YecE (DUF72 family)